jgi:surfeit locus 1 family protein
MRVLFSLKMIGLHVFTILLVVIMVSLGFWQLRRHDERVTFNDAVRARSLTAPLSPTALLALDSDVANVEWFTLQASGQYLPDEDVNVSQDGQAGIDPVSALQLDDGRILLVNRGFIPLSQAVPAAPSGSVTVVGRVRTTDVRQRGELSDAREGDLREIQRIDLARLQDQLPGEVLPVYIDLLASNPPEAEVLSRIAAPELTLGPHLAYTVQWIVFSLCAVAAWGFIVRRALAPVRRAAPQAPTA